MVVVFEKILPLTKESQEFPVDSYHFYDCQFPGAVLYIDCVHLKSMRLVLPTHFTDENTRTERQSNLSKITQLLNCRAGI